MTFDISGHSVVRFGLAASVLLTATGMAQAQRPDIRTMTCEQAMQLVQQSGAVVMTTGQHTFQRFVANSNYCDPHETTARAWFATKDTEMCDLSFCKHVVDDDDDDDDRTQIDPPSLQ